MTAKLAIKQLAKSPVIARMFLSVTTDSADIQKLMLLCQKVYGYTAITHVVDRGPYRIDLQTRTLFGPRPIQISEGIMFLIAAIALSAPNTKLDVAVDYAKKTLVAEGFNAVLVNYRANIITNEIS